MTRVRSSRRRKAVSPPNVPSLRVVLFDEHSGSRSITSYLFRTAGHRCFPVAGIDELVSAVETHKPDVVMYEWNTRSSDGIGLARRLRNASERELRVMVVSTLDEPPGFCDREGIDAYATKPVVARELHNALRAWFPPPRIS